MRRKKKARTVPPDVYAIILSSDKRVMKSLSAVLQSGGCQVQTTDHYETAIQRIYESKTPLFFMDPCHGERFEQDLQPMKPGQEPPRCIVFILAEQSKRSEAEDWAERLNGYRVSIPIAPEKLLLQLERAFEVQACLERLSNYTIFDENSEQFGACVSRSPEYKKTIRIARLLSNRNDPLLIIGGIGSGKELLAQTIHEHSPRRFQPFVSIACTSLPAGEIAHEVFGSDLPDRKAPGLLETCNHGTLMLDNFDALESDLQARILKYFEDGVFTRVGSRTTSQSDVRIIAASSKPIDEMVASGHFSEDLYFFINRFTLHIPGLFRRVEDIPILCQVTLKSIGARIGKPHLTITASALEKILQHTWPGNIRELEYTLEYAALVCENETIEPQHLPKRFHDNIGSIFVGSSPDELPPFREIEKQYILRVMESVRGNKVKAAKILDINRATLHRKLHIYKSQKQTLN